MSATLLDDARPVARKAHVCEACFGTILPGTPYVRQKLVEDFLWTWKGHEWCNSLYWVMHRDAGLMEDEGVDPGELRERFALMFRWMSEPYTLTELDLGGLP